MISAIVLAAGLSQRMGDENKLMLPVEGVPMIRRVVESVAASSVTEVWVVLGHEADRVRDVLEGLPVSITLNEHFQLGMTTSIQQGIRMADIDTQGYMICLADLPFMDAGDYDLLIRHFEMQLSVDSRLMVKPVFQGQQGNPVLFAAQYRSELLAHEEMEGCRAVVKRYRRHLCLYEMPNSHCLHDIDTPEAYQELVPD